MGIKDKKTKTIIGTFIVIVLAAVLIFAGTGIFKYAKERQALKLVQDGYMGRYNTITTKEVMDAYPRDEDSQRWDVETKKINGEKRLFVNFSFNDDSIIKFLTAKDEKTYKVYEMKISHDKVNSDEFGDFIDDMYTNYMENHPSGDVNAAHNFGNSDRGKSGKLQKMEQGSLYKTDMKEYVDKLWFQSTIDRLELAQEEETKYWSKEYNLGIELYDDSIPEYVDDTDLARIDMYIYGNQSMTPAFYGVRIGDSVDLVKQQLESEGFKFQNDKQQDRRLSRCTFIGSDGSTVIADYRIKQKKICYLWYSKDIKVLELQKYGYVQDKLITGISAEIEKSTSSSINEYIFPDSDTKYLSEDEVRAVETDKLMVGRNEIFARHGYIFEDEGLKKHFGSTSWYQGTVQGNQFSADAVFNDFEKKNVELIKKIEDELNGVQEQFIGLAGTYICTTPETDDFTGKIEILGVGNSSIQYSLGGLELPSAIVTGDAKIIGNNSAQADLYGFTFTFTWSDSENMYVTSKGELTGMDSGTIMSITNGMGYTRPLEFNQR